MTGDAFTMAGEFGDRRVIIDWRFGGGDSGLTMTAYDADAWGKAGGERIDRARVRGGGGTGGSTYRLLKRLQAAGFTTLQHNSTEGLGPVLTFPEAMAVYEK